MEINNTSPLNEVLQALGGTWDLTESDGWKVLEVGKFRIFKKLAEKDREETSIPLPDKFIKQRKEITPYLTFKADTMSGGIINLQQTAIDLGTTDAVLLVIIQF